MRSRSSPLFSDQIAAGGQAGAATESALGQLAGFHPYRVSVSGNVLRRSLSRAAAFGVVTAIVTAFAADGGLLTSHLQSSPPPSMSTVAALDSTDVPVLRLTLGDSMDLISRHSTMTVPPRTDPLRDPPFIVAGKPVTVEYTRPGAAVRFPTGLFTSVTVEYGHAVGLRISPHTHALTLGEALALARQIEASVEHAGWRLATTYVPLAAVPNAVEAARHTTAGQAVGYEASLARWSGPDGDTLVLSIRRQTSAEAVRDENAWTGKQRAEVDYYLLSVEVENSVLSERFYRSTVAARDRANTMRHP